MRTWIEPFIAVSIAWAAVNSGAYAQDVGAVASGDWNVGSTWTSGTAPGSSNSVFIGSTYPAGSALTATVTLTQSQSALDVYLGYGLGSSGTLSLGNNALTIDGNLYIGAGGAGSLQEGAGGSFTAQSVSVANGNLLTFGANDSVSSLQLDSSSTATTAAVGNVTGYVYVAGGSTLKLGAAMNLSGSELDVLDSGSVFNMNGHSLTAGTLTLGWYGSSAVTLANAGAINVGSLEVGNGQTFNINGSDTVGSFSLSGGSSTLNNSVATLNLTNGATASTTASGSVTGYVSIAGGSTLKLGAAMNLSGSELDVLDSGSVFNMNGHSLTAGTLTLGWYGSSAVTLANAGAINVGSLEVGNGQTFNINGSDTVGSFSLSGGSSTLNNSVATLNLTNGATASTTASGSVTGYVSIAGGSTLKLGAAMNLSGSELDVLDSGSVFNMNGHSLTAGTLTLGWYGSSAVTLANAGAINVGSLEVGNGQTFNINGSDTVGSFSLSGGSSTLNNSVATLNLTNGATASTTASGSVTGYVSIAGGSTLKLGAAMNLSGSELDVLDSGSVFNMNGHSLTAGTLTLGWYGSSAVTLANAGAINVGSLEVGNGTSLTLHGGDVINSGIDLAGGSTLIVDQTNGTGLTLMGTSLSSLTIDPSSMDLIFNSNAADNWDFRWLDPAGGGNWISTIDGMIADHEIMITAPYGYQVVDSGGYTYIEGFAPASVPEPSSLLLACIACVGVAARMRWTNRRTAR